MAFRFAVAGILILICKICLCKVTDGLAVAAIVAMIATFPGAIIAFPGAITAFPGAITTFPGTVTAY